MWIISLQDDHFAMEVGRQPITFENPLYATAPAAASGDPAVIHATQVVSHVFYGHRLQTEQQHVYSVMAC